MPEDNQPTTAPPGSLDQVVRPKAWKHMERGKSKVVLLVIQRLGMAKKWEIAEATGLGKYNVACLCNSLMAAGKIRRIREPWSKCDEAAWEPWPNSEVSGAGATASNEQPKSATRQRSLD